MTIALNNHQVTRFTNNAGSYTLSSYAVPAGSDRVLVVTVLGLRSSENSIALASVTFGAAGLTKAADIIDMSSSRYYYAGIWYLVNPAVSTADISFTITGGSLAGSIISAVTLTGVDQTTPIAGYTTLTTTGQTLAFEPTDTGGDATWTGDAGDLAVYAVTANANNNPTWLWDDGELYDLNNGTSSNSEIAGSGAASVGYPGAWCSVSPARTIGVGVGFNEASGTVYEQAIAGGLSFAGVPVKRTGKPTAGALTSSGVVIRRTGKRTAGALGFGGNVVKRTAIRTAGALSFAGNVTRRAGKTLAGAIGFAGNVARRIPVRLAGALGFSGVVSQSKAFLLALAGGLGFGGNVAKRPGKALAGTLTTAGDVSRGVRVRVAGALSFVGIVGRRIPARLAGAVGFSGNVSRRAAVSLAGALSAAGDIRRRVGKALAGGLDFGGAVDGVRTRLVSLVGALGMSGVVGKATATGRVSGALGLSGDVRFRYPVRLAGALGLAGGVGRATGKALAGVVGFSGDVAKQTARRLAGALSFVGSSSPFHFPGGYVPGFIHLTARARSFALNARARFFALTARDRNRQ